MRKPRGDRRARRRQASRSTCTQGWGARTSSTRRCSQPTKASREAARTRLAFQKQRALARRKARKSARPPGFPAACPASRGLSTSASEPGASCTGRAIPSARLPVCPSARPPVGPRGPALTAPAPAALGTVCRGRGRGGARFPRASLSLLGPRSN